MADVLIERVWWGERVLEGTILLLALVCSYGFTDLIVNRVPHSRPANRAIAAPHDRCQAFRFIDRPDSAYFELACAKPLPDTIRVLTRFVP